MCPNPSPLPVEELDPLDGDEDDEHSATNPTPLEASQSDVPQVVDPERLGQDWRVVNARLVTLLYEAGLDAEEWTLEDNLPPQVDTVAEQADEWAYWVGVDVSDVVCFRNRMTDDWRLFIEVETDNGSLPSDIGQVSREGGVVIERMQSGTALLYVSPSYDWADRLADYRATA